MQHYTKPPILNVGRQRQSAQHHGARWNSHFPHLGRARHVELQGRAAEAHNTTQPIHVLMT